MSDDRMFERDARAWLELGPTQAPPPVVRRALQVIQATPQQRALHIPWRLPSMTSRARFLVAVAVGVIAVMAAGALMIGRQQMLVGTPSATPTVLASPSASPISLQPIKGTWASVGTRNDPIGNHANPPMVESITFDQNNLSIDTYQAVTSAVSTVSLGSHLTLQVETPQKNLDRQFWDCRTGDIGSYEESLSPDGQTLTLTSVGDSCRTRAAILGGDWTRWSCPNSTDGAFCDHYSEQAPGRYVDANFTPFGSGTSLAYTLPAGWANVSRPPTWPEPNFPTRNLNLTTIAEPHYPAISVYSNMVPSSIEAVRFPTPNSCSSGLAAGPSAAPAEVGDFLASLPYLKISNRTTVTIGGLSGVQVDVSLVDGFFDPCSSGSGSGGSIEYSRTIEIFQDNDTGFGVYLDPSTASARFVILGEGSRRVLVVVQDFDSQATGGRHLDALVATAMPVINSFEFIR